eukprot:gnl/TRDRNA2_/TRDRNA2_87532_c0_seq1.p1 gnl/TRDRNA2_/TRDRNA2_87532_c0~~gnl/TRDRNA2_/TRDRNA2_87532_c0_seq1.p1  ORF type:complete len:124 (-),score=24.55 gnl/TRDRNA2_/TRDRNA2_87532_c0_seq1:70-441(-)
MPATMESNCLARSTMKDHLRCSMPMCPESGSLKLDTLTAHTLAKLHLCHMHESSAASMSSTTIGSRSTVSTCGSDDRSDALSELDVAEDDHQMIFRFDEEMCEEQAIEENRSLTLSDIFFLEE